MFDLKATVNAYIETETKEYIDRLLDQDWCDSIAFYETTIRELLPNMFWSIEKNPALVDLIIDHIVANQEQYITVKRCAFPCSSDGEIALHSINEYVFNIHALPFKLTDNRINAINDNTDLIINDDQAFMYADYDHVCLDLNKVGSITIRELEQ